MYIYEVPLQGKYHSTLTFNRGIQPSLSTPQNDAERLSSWNVDSADHVDLFLNGWLVKRKRNRGRGSNSSVSSGSYLSSFESEQSMLDRILMQLFRELHEKEMKRERRKAKARLCGSKKLEWDLDDEYRLQDCFPPGWDDEFRRDFQARKADELGLSKDSFRVNERASRNKKRKHDHSPHHETRSADEAFKKASRNKRTKFDLSFRCETGPADHMFASVGDIIKLEEDHRDPADVVEPPPGISHECKTCGKGFPTGQALGGHMKAQYKQVDDPVESFDGLEVLVAEPVLLLPGLDPAQSQQGEDGDQGTGQVVQPFDLNELPIEAYMQDAHESWL
ncbi:hypothetical protein Droror1_Dr00023329 [Drosera rotundifolia]